ncbi:MAG: hypothetical protein NZ602_13405 [Thermoguttaceae bacterium]|nr:hypothetical protein [Thermoguttaceae bacterium]MDW8037806.1 hypothetical protein [Thermoguttaceae bacterium]
MALAQPGLGEDARFLAGLRERGLYELAERYCQRLLTDKDLPVAGRAEISIELSITLAEKALAAPPAHRAKLWQQAQQPLEAFLQQYPQSAWAVQVRLQEALNLLAWGELARQEAELTQAGAEAMEEARHQLRQAIRRLEELLRVVEGLRRESAPTAGRPIRPPEEPTPPAAHWEAMAETIRYELARAYRNQAQTYPAASAERADGLLQALKLLEWTARHPTEHPLVWKARVDQIVCLRLLGRWDEAHQSLAHWLEGKPSLEIDLRLQAEKIRLLLAEGKPAEAAALAQQLQKHSVRSAELDLAVLETYVAQWEAAQKAQDAQQAEMLYQRASEQVRLLGQQYGPYWMRRGEVLLAARLGRAPETAQVATLIRAAEGFYRSGKLQEAIQAYDQAQKAAREAGDGAGAFQAGFVAATIYHQQGHHAEALARYRQLAYQWPEHPEAPKAHELAIHHAAELAKTGSAEALEQYSQLLAEHRRRWPQHPSTNRIRHLAGRLAELRRDWAGAVEAYQEISPSDPDFAQAVQSVGRVYGQWLAQEKAAGKLVAARAQEAARWFESLILGPDGRLPERWSPAQQAAVLAAARLWLDFTPKGYLQAERLLAAALQACPDADPQWKSDAQILWVYCLAASGQTQQAMQVLQEVGTAKPEILLILLEGLGRLSATGGPEVRPAIANLQLQTIELLQTRQGQLPEAIQRTLVRLHAQALADLGQPAQALAAFRAAAYKYPKDSRIQEMYAQFCTNQPDLALVEEGLRKWQEISRLAPLGSPLWFRAQYGMCLAECRLNRSQQALERIRRLEILYPSMGGPELATQFRRLKTQCQKGN